MKDPVDRVLYDQNDGAGDVLGFLISPDGDVQHEVSNYSCIGR